MGTPYDGDPTIHKLPEPSAPEPKDSFTDVKID